MPALLFNKCCGCIELRTGCLIIGYLQLVGEIIGIIMMIMTAIGGSVLLVSKPDDEKADQYHVAGGVLLITSVILLIIIGVYLALTIVLLVGVHNSKRGHIKAYLIGAVVLLVLGTITVLAGIAHATASSIVSNIISLLLSIYFLLVIRSYYYKMEEPQKPSYNTPAVFTSG